MRQRRFSAAAQGCVLVGTVLGLVVTIGTARAAEPEATGSVREKSDRVEWWRLRTAQAAIDVPKSTGEALPETRKTVRMVYPAPFQAR